jgi:HAD superfamily phosphoserine phosphatase-like hydrolase
MSHHLLPGMATDWVHRLHNILLIRDPAQVVDSYLKSRATVAPEDIGLLQQAQLFDRLAQRSGQAPMVIDAEDFLQAPEAFLRAVCGALGIAFTPRMLHWPAGRRDSDGIWAPYWYDAVWASTGFEPWRPRAPQLQGQALAVAEACRPPMHSCTGTGCGRRPPRGRPVKFGRLCPPAEPLGPPMSHTEFAPGLKVQGLTPPLRLADYRLAAFDMDSTLINLECVDEIASAVGKKAEVAAITEAAMRGEIADYKESLRQRVALLRGVPVSAMQAIYDERLQLNPGVATFVAACQAAGLKTLLVSGGFTFFTDRVKDRLKLDFARSNVLEIEATP